MGVELLRRLLSMNKSYFDVAVIWRRPFWPITVAIVVVELALIPFALEWSLWSQLLFPVLVLAWLVVALFINSRMRGKLRREHSS